MNGAHRPCDLFPKRLQDTESPKIFETLGFAGLSWGVFSLMASLWALLQRSAKDTGSYAVFAIGARIVAAFLLVKEICQRRQRAVLVLGKESLGLYRQGSLSGSFALDQVTIDHVERLFGSMMLAVFLSIVAVVVIAGALTEQDVTTTASISYKVMLFGLGMLGALTVSSLVWTWFACHRVLIVASRGKTTFMLIRPSSASNLFIRTLAARNFEATIYRCYGFAKTSE